MLIVEAETTDGQFMILIILMAAALNAGVAGIDGSKMSAVTAVFGSASGPVCVRMMPDGIFKHPVPPRA